MQAAAADAVLGLRPAVTAPVVAASAAVLVGVRADATMRRGRERRRHERRRTAVLELQEAALGLRSALRAYGLALRSGLQEPQAQPQPPEVRPSRPVGPVGAEAGTTELRAAEGLLEVRVVRLDDTGTHRALGTSVTAWRQTAKEHFVGPYTVFAAAEQAAWDRLDRAVSRALRSGD